MDGFFREKESSGINYKGDRNMMQEFSLKKDSEGLSSSIECVLKKRFTYVNLNKDLFLVRVVMKMKT